MKFHIKTYGCQMNERDSEAIAALLVENGHAEASRESAAEVVIVNTCSVRGKAQDKAIGKLGLLAAGKRERPELKVGAVGCVVQQMKESIFEQVPLLDFALGPRRIASLPSVLATVAAGGTGIIDVGDNGRESDNLSCHKVDGPSAFISILHGCDRKCSYCVVPAVRSSERSRNAAVILAEAKTLAAEGVKEVTLLGQSVMSYGRKEDVCAGLTPSKLGFSEPLPRLLEAVAGIPAIRRIRFTSGHPSGCTVQLARAMSDLPPLCEHLHIPLQSASDRILKMMHRGYTAKDYRESVARLREAVPQIAITTDIIVGFPTESEDDFNTTKAFMDEIGFDNAFIFKYSPRPETQAAELRDDVGAGEKMRRNKILLEDQDLRATAINSRLIGTAVEVLADGRSLRNAARWSGRTRTNKIVIFEPLNGMRKGDLIEVRVERVTAQTLYGVPI